jgi:hypothetical protein
MKNKKKATPLRTNRHGRGTGLTKIRDESKNRAFLRTLTPKSAVDLAEHMSGIYEPDLPRTK